MQAKLMDIVLDAKWQDSVALAEGQTSRVERNARVVHATAPTPCHALGSDWTKASFRQVLSDWVEWTEAE